MRPVGALFPDSSVFPDADAHRVLRVHKRSRAEVISGRKPDDTDRGAYRRGLRGHDPAMAGDADVTFRVES